MISVGNRPERLRRPLRRVLLLTCLLLTGAAAATARAGVVEASRLYEDAARSFAHHDYDAAIAQAKNSLLQNKNQGAANLLLGKAYLAKQDPNSALTALLEAQRQGVNRSELALPLARAYIDVNQPAMAIEAVTGDDLNPSIRIEALLLRGEAYTRLNEPRPAAEAFNAARAIDPNSILIALEEAPLLLRTGQIARARDAAAHAITVAPNNYQVWNMDAAVLREAGDANASLAAFTRAISLSPPGDRDARVGRASLLLDLGDAADAAKDVTELLHEAPKDIRVIALQGMLARLQGDTATATTAFGKVATAFDPAPASWLSAHDKFAIIDARAQQGLGRPQKALSIIDALLSAQPHNVSALKFQAELYLDMHQYAKAEPAVAALQDADPTDPRLLYERGEVYLGLGRYGQAVTTLQAVLAKMDSPAVRRSLGLAQLHAGFEDAGVANLQKAFNATHDIEAGGALAVYQIQHGQNARALAIGDALVKLNPRNPWAINLSGEIKGQCGDHAGARAAFNQALAIDPTLGPAQVNLARLDALEGHLDQARARLNDMIAKGDDPRAMFELGRIEEQAGQLDNALKQYRRATEVSGGQRDPTEALISLLMKMHRSDDAVVAARQYSERFPNDIELRLSLARALTAKGDLAGARVELTGATKIADFDPDMQVRIGYLQLDAGNPDGAAYNAVKALQGRPEDIKALGLGVSAALVGKDPGTADKDYQILASRYPDKKVTLLSAAAIALSKHDVTQAVAVYTHALALYPSTGVELQLGRALVMAGQPAAAARAHAEWLKKSPQDLAVRSALAEALFQSGQLAEAKRNYLAVVAREPGNAQQQNNLANLLLAMGDYAGAKAAAAAALKVDSKNSNYMDTMGWIQSESGQPDVGLPYLREARLRSPENAEIRIHLALVLTKLGHLDEARDELAAALQISPGVAQVPAVADLKSRLLH
ncbi:MAG: PEP-CTERM system TPR-repeat protein PrsT [Burkholderiales bacterium]|nr:PEP-CTERM system TPR-repeat protein PrsT [Burkholderiales bacterium]MDE1926106.1 PEP-CTERM system TPR-repeat protein PrsT [Burkholderiales bacterium]MDE2159488.1 PEP-CTERM system TPR-repeat protein PrsT [Burkholderiales bacterium]MDE2504763.1 PEP-CTERM system TPR-repeat protein PrsT [Burkholderiales bacterium]